MRLKSAHLHEFKRFTDLRVLDVPDAARLIVLCGPNGSGKSSFFDALRTWHMLSGASGAGGLDTSFTWKANAVGSANAQQVNLAFHDNLPNEPQERNKRVYLRSAYRNEPEFMTASFTRLPPDPERQRVWRTIENDASVSDNYQRLIAETMTGVYDPLVPAQMTVVELRERLIGQIREAMARVLPGLTLEGVGSPLDQGSFYFTKGVAHNFIYKNLSAGEKAAFDLILDMVVKRRFYDNSLWCIDEPETHLNARVQGSLLKELVQLLPEQSQLLLATHSLGFMRQAWDMQKERPGEVAFLDFQDHDFDQTIELRPVVVSRDFWRRTVEVALGDMAGLVAPGRVVLCEGKPASTSRVSATAAGRGEFDARCYRVIFADEFADTDFISVGNSHAVNADQVKLGLSIQTLVSGTTIIRVVDRDHLNEDEVAEHLAAGVRVLSRRHIESFLLDDEVIAALCASLGRDDLTAAAIAERDKAIRTSVEQGRDADDYKSMAGDCYTRLRKLLELRGSGSTWEAFATGTLAPLIKPSLNVYRHLRRDIFAS